MCLLGKEERAQRRRDGPRTALKGRMLAFTSPRPDTEKFHIPQLSHFLGPRNRPKIADANASTAIVLQSVPQEELDEKSRVSGLSSYTALDTADSRIMRA